MSTKEFASQWDTKVKGMAVDVVETCRTDPVATHYVAQMVFYVEHDLADDRDPTLRLQPCLGTLDDEAYYTRMHKNTPAAEVTKLRALGQALKTLSHLE